MTTLSRQHLSEIIAKKTLHVTDTKQLARSIAAYLLLEHKTADLEPLMRDIMQYRQDNGVVEADVLTAHELTNNIQSEIKQLLKQYHPEAKHVTLHQKHSDSVVGGVVMQLPAEQLDLSVANKIATFKRLTNEEAVNV